MILLREYTSVNGIDKVGVLYSDNWSTYGGVQVYNGVPAVPHLFYANTSNQFFKGFSSGGFILNSNGTPLNYTITQLTNSTARLEPIYTSYWSTFKLPAPQDVFMKLVSNDKYYLEYKPEIKTNIPYTTQIIVP